VNHFFLKKGGKKRFKDRLQAIIATERAGLEMVVKLNVRQWEVPK
jgi:septum formation topological specificity factor MinE